MRRRMLIQAMTQPECRSTLAPIGPDLLVWRGFEQKAGSKYRQWTELQDFIFHLHGGATCSF
jgi:hypothetical protein